MPRKPKPRPRQRRPYGGGSISVAADGAIRARTAPDADGRRRSRTFRPGQQAAAEAWLLAVASPAQPVEAAPPVTLGDWRAFWLDTYVRPFAPPNTVHWATYALDKLAPLDGAPLADVRTSALQEIVGRLGVRGATTQGIVGYWRRCLAAAVHDELIARNPAVPLITPRAEPRTARRFVTPAEAQALLRASVGHRFEAAYALLLGCGLRIGEVLGLSWQHVELGAQRAYVCRQWTNSHWRELPKGRTPRWISLPPAVVAALIRHRNAQPEGCALVLQSPLNRSGRPRRDAGSGPWPYSRKVVADDLAALVAALGLPGLTTHAARRGYITALLDGGVPAAVVAQLAGHADPSITLRAYAQATDAGREQATRLIGEYLGETAPEDASGAVS